jgi:hypothetical protein
LCVSPGNGSIPLSRQRKAEKPPKIAKDLFLYYEIRRESVFTAFRRDSSVFAKASAVAKSYGVTGPPSLKLRRDKPTRLKKRDFGKFSGKFGIDILEGESII